MRIGPGGCTAFRSHSNSNIPTHPGREAVRIHLLRREPTRTVVLLSPSRTVRPPGFAHALPLWCFANGRIHDYKRQLEDVEKAVKAKQDSSTP